jgi:hypothetical protein
MVFQAWTPGWSFGTAEDSRKLRERVAAEQAGGGEGRIWKCLAPHFLAMTPT